MGTTPSDEDVAGFISGAFRSIWALELVLLLKGDADRSWRRDELVAALRASTLVVDGGIDALMSAGLVIALDDGMVRYAPASRSLAMLVDSTEQLYAQRPDWVRRLIVLSGNDRLNAFADAFRLRKD